MMGLKCKVLGHDYVFLGVSFDFSTKDIPVSILGCACCGAFSRDNLSLCLRSYYPYIEMAVPNKHRVMDMAHMARVNQMHKISYTLIFNKSKIEAHQ
jgi:hypothetical protein